jgi:3-oxoacyl-[acyl-carrier-protein] synthase-1
LEFETVISGIGMVTPVGMNGAQTSASVRTGITRMREADDIYLCLADDPDFEDATPLIASTLSYLEHERRDKSTPAEWLAHIAAHAFRDLQSSVELTRSDCRQTGLFMALPSQRPQWGAADEDQFVYHFHNCIEKDVFPVEEFAYQGHAGALTLYASACRRLAEGQIKYALLAGAESYLFAHWLERLDHDYRIKSDRNPDGFIPGEGAAFVLLEPAGQPEKNQRRSLARVGNVKGAQCPQTELSHNTGTVLSRLLKDMLDSTTDAPIIVCDLNGEPARMKEWGYTVVRLGEKLGAAPIVVHPADCLGDLGAASGPVHIGLSIHFLARQYARHPSALVWSASDSGERMAMLIERALNA